MCMKGSTKKRRKKARHTKAKNAIQDIKNLEKPTQKETKNNPALKKGAQTLREATKKQHNIITERRALRKHKTGLKKNTRGNN